MSILSPSVTIAQAKDWLRRRVDDGERCPVCTQYAKVYRRAIHATMARTLILAYQTHGQDWFHLATLTKTTGRGGEEGKLRYWGLLEEETERRPDGGRSGWWRVTDDGAAFVERRRTVQKYARIYDGRCLGLDGDLIGIKDALGKKFNYDDLMKGI